MVVLVTVSPRERDRSWKGWVRHAGTALAAAALALQPTACGGDGGSAADGSRLAKARYEQRMQDLLGEVERDDAAARDGGEAAYRTAIASISAAARQLHALDPPAEVAQAHRDYATGFDAFARARVSALRAGLRGDRARARGPRTQVPASVRRQVMDARRSLAERGYDITPPGR